MRLRVLLLFVLSGLFASAQSSWKVDFKVEGYEDSLAFLAYRWGNKQYYMDTAVVTKEKFSFSGDELRAGIYMVVGTKNNYLFEYVLDETNRNFIIETDTSYTDLKFINSDDNADFKAYGSFVSGLSEKAQEISNKLKLAEKDSEEEKALKAELEEINAQVTKAQEVLINTYPTSLIAYILKAQQEIDVPEAPEELDEAEGRAWRFRYYKRHYWDKFDFNDQRIVYTPVFQQKLKAYFDNLVIQDPDTVNAEVDHFLGMFSDKKEFYKQTFVFLYEKYNASKVICMDKVYVNLALNWYGPDQAYWATEKQITKIRERARELKPGLCGNKATNMRLKDTTNAWRELYELDNKYTILFFWDPDCGHCKKVTPEMIKVYHRYMDAGVDFFSVGGAQDIPEWREFIRAHNLDWINVTDNMKDQFINNFREVYDIYAYPKMYVLDKDKNIIIKSLTAVQLDKYLKEQCELEPNEEYPAPKNVNEKAH